MATSPPSSSISRRKVLRASAGVESHPLRAFMPTDERQGVADGGVVRALTAHLEIGESGPQPRCGTSTTDEVFYTMAET